MDHPLGSLIRDEVARTESDYQGVRTRAQAVLTISGILVTGLAGLMALAAGRDEHLDLSAMTKVAVAGTLFFFVLAGVMVLLILVPRDVKMPDPKLLGTYVKNDWDAKGWDKRVASVLATYLDSLRSESNALARKLALAVFFQVLGLLCAFFMVLALLDSA